MDRIHKPCNICYHLGWSECSMKGQEVIAYAGHIIELKNLVIKWNTDGYCGECDSGTIVKQKVVSVDTICNARLNLCKHHIEDLKEDNSLDLENND